jgi:hypothetical protein
MDKTQATVNTLSKRAIGRRIRLMDLTAFQELQHKRLLDPPHVFGFYRGKRNPHSVRYYPSGNPIPTNLTLDSEL